MIRTMTVTLKKCTRRNKSNNPCNMRKTTGRHWSLAFPMLGWYARMNKESSNTLKNKNNIYIHFCGQRALKSMLVIQLVYERLQITGELLLSF